MRHVFLAAGLALMSVSFAAPALADLKPTKRVEPQYPPEAAREGTTGFVELEAIEPAYFDSTYYLQPRKEHAKVYGLLRDALSETGRAGIATMSMRQKDYLVAVHEQSGVLVMHTLHWADEVRDPHETLSNLPSGAEASSGERTMATQLIEAMAIDWNPHDYQDRTQERVRELIEAKRTGQTVEKGEGPPESTNVVDLMSALEASVDRARSGGAEKRSSTRAGAKKTTQAKKTTPAKKTTQEKAEKAEKGTQAKKAEKRTQAKKGTQAKKATKAERAEAGAGPGGGKKRGGKAPRQDLESLTKEELYDLAAEAGVPGRSRMTRDELKRALTRGAKAA